MAAGEHIVGDYVLRGLLGAGGMSSIYLADVAGSDQRFRRKVALKLMRTDTGIRDATLLLRDEAVNLSFLSHPNLVNVNRVGTLGGRFFIEMEYISGVSLRTLRDKLFIAGRLPPIDLIAAILSRACDGLHSAHEQTDREGRPLGLIHRDISPHNIMLSLQGEVKVIDFGVARSSNRTWETRPGRMVGKPAYMAPEQIDEARARRVDLIDRRADLWAMGAVLFEMCTGHRLFPGSGLLEILDRVQTGEIKPLEELRPDTPPRLSEVFRRLLNRHREERPATAHELATTLRQVVADAGNRFAERSSIVDFLARHDISLQPLPPSALSSMDIAWVEQVNQTEPGDWGETAVVEPPDPWHRLLGTRLGRGRFELRTRLDQGSEQVGVLEQRWFDAHDLEFDRPVRVMAVAAADGSALPSSIHDALALQVDHIRQLYPARGQLLEGGTVEPAGAFALVFGSPPTTLADLEARALTVSRRLAITRAIVHALQECRRVLPDFVHGALVPRQIGLRELDHDHYEASLLGVSLAVITRDWPSANGMRLVGPPEGYRAPEFDTETTPTAAMDIFTLGAIAYGLLGGDPVDAAHRLARGRPPIRLPVDGNLDARVEGILFAALRVDATDRPTIDELAGRFALGPPITASGSTPPLRFTPASTHAHPTPLPAGAAMPTAPAIGAHAIGAHAIGAAAITAAAITAPFGQRTAITAGSNRIWLTLLLLDPHRTEGSEGEVLLPFPPLESLAPAALVVHLRQGPDDPILRIRMHATASGRLPKIYRGESMLQSVMLRPSAIPDFFDFGHRRGQYHRIHCHGRTFAPPDPRVLEPPGLGVVIALPSEARSGVAMYAITPQTDEIHLICLAIPPGDRR